MKGRILDTVQEFSNFLSTKRAEYYTHIYLDTEDDTTSAATIELLNHSQNTKVSNTDSDNAVTADFKGKI